jgi:regulator of sigma E protease
MVHDDAAAQLMLASLSAIKNYALVFIGFSVVVFFHELGHFIAAKLCDVRVERFSVGFGREIFGWTRGETRYSFNILPFGGYVKMLGQEDFAVDKTGELQVKEDPRAFSHKPIWQRMIIVSSGVVMNVFFAALAFMAVFMLGTDFPPAAIGIVRPESPAARVGLMPGDRVIEINGHKPADFADLSATIRLSDPDQPLNIVIERDTPDQKEPIRRSIQVQPESNDEQDSLELGVGPKLNTVVSDARPDPALPPEEMLKNGDEIVAVSDEPVSQYHELLAGLYAKEGDFAKLTVHRPQEDSPDPKTLEVRRRVFLAFITTGDFMEESGHLLGLLPRRRVVYVTPESRAELAGFQTGDVITQWADHSSPRIDEIMDSIAANAEKDLHVRVERYKPGEGWSEKKLLVRPEAQGVMGQDRPMVGMNIFRQEQWRPVVADIVPELSEDEPTVCGHLKDRMVRGSTITSVGDTPIETWLELVDVFRQQAGNEVSLAWIAPDGKKDSATIKIPRTLGTAGTFELPAGHMITEIDGEYQIEIVRDGEPKLYSAASWRGARELLKSRIGKTVTIEHRGMDSIESQSAQVEVTEEMLNTWTLRVSYDMPDVATEMVMTEVRVGNPVEAMMIGMRKTYYFIEQVYVMMQRMVITRSVGFKEVSGPVGIVKMGSDIAERDLVKLLYFLALISANLAVINFLPLPIVDGGLFVFLIVEKIKGGPIPIKVQVATQLIGLALIISIFLYVTFNDIQRMFG